MGAATSIARGGSNADDEKSASKNDLDQGESDARLDAQDVEETNFMLRDAATPAQVSGTRLTQLMCALKRMARLEREATNAQIDSREKRRESSFKRQNVWMRDDKFMGELHRLVADGELTAFPQLERLADTCQTARDELGQVEQENIEAEQRWESRIWKLQEAAEEFQAEFSHEFEEAETYSDTKSSTSSQYEQCSNFGQENDHSPNIFNGDHAIHYNAAVSVASSSSQHFRMSPHTEFLAPMDTMFPTESVLPDLIAFDEKTTVLDDTVDWNSAIDDINGPLDCLPTHDSIGAGIPLPVREYASLELYPQLLTDFSSARDRINRWLKDTSLVSRLEPLCLFSSLRIEFEAENRAVPSNWAQLAIAFWELDGAAIPNSNPYGKTAVTDLEPQIVMERQEVIRDKPNRIAPEVRQGSSIYSPALSTSSNLHAVGSRVSKRDHNRGRKTSTVSRPPGLAASLSLSPPSPPRSPLSFDARSCLQGELEEPP